MPEHLELATLSDLPRSITLSTTIGSLKALIHKDGELWVRLVRTLDAHDPLPEKYGVPAVAGAMAHAAGLLLNSDEEAKQRPFIASAGWALPDEVYWKLRLPASFTGAEVLAAVRASDEFIMKITEKLLAQQAVP